MRSWRSCSSGRAYYCLSGWEAGSDLYGSLYRSGAVDLYASLTDDLYGGRCEVVSAIDEDGNGCVDLEELSSFFETMNAASGENQPVVYMGAAQ